ncbi:ATPase [Thermus scotoductus]|uniref:ATPase n=1 Tax=Thermus scotoductus TaxID=37636 RepID=A0A430R4T6_THESC|nr:ATPase [Thermus scotoductus]RTH02363.1 ATPase [Thermus scotoductus]RTH19909.1 ATPase [Thermus scotoductus]RTH99967.1 ATPase [Thermus scotoductus]RTI21865.1 ATPase [Thermus scotoductus]
MYNPKEGEFKTELGPIFAHLLLADEINRAPPKVQSALLEAMQERAVTAGGVRYPLPEPFFVVTTPNPIESEGTYPLPEAQLDPLERALPRAGVLSFVDPETGAQVEVNTLNPRVREAYRLRAEAASLRLGPCLRPAPSLPSGKGRKM